MKVDRKNVALPAELYKKLEAKIRGSGFRSVDDYAAFILERALKEDGQAETYSKEEEELMKKRLKALGYME